MYVNVSPVDEEALQLYARAVVRLINNDIKEYNTIIKKLNSFQSQYHDCYFVRNKKKIKAKINFERREIIDEHGILLKAL